MLPPFAEKKTDRSPAKAIPQLSLRGVALRVRSVDHRGSPAQTYGPAAYAYKLVREMNEELKQKGFLTIPGRVSRNYFEEKFYGLRENQ